MNFVENFAEGVAKNIALDKANEYAVDKFSEFAKERVKTKDPYRYETPDGKTKKLKLRENATKEEQKMWKWVQKRAWLDDKCFMGCYPVDCGIGLGPLAVAIPCIGPLLMYAVHARLITKAGMYYKLDSKTVAKLQANILFDLLISIPPFVGSFFTWLNGCSTRNAAIIHTEVTKMLIERERGSLAGAHELHDVQTQTTYGGNPFNNKVELSNNGTKMGDTQYQAKPNYQNKTSYNNNTTNYKAGNPTLPPRDYNAPRPPNRVYQSQNLENSGGFRSVV